MAYSKTKAFVAACAGMAFFGVAMLSLGPILGPLNAIVAGANALPATMSLGIIAGTLLFGPVVDRFGYKWLLIISSILALAGLQGLANFTTIGLLHVSIFCLGLGGGILNGETNALVSDIYEDKDRSGKMALLGAFYCIGALLWTLLNYFIPNFRIPLNAASIVMALFILWFFFVQFPEAKPVESQSLSKSLGLLKYPALLLFGLVLFFQSGFEGISGNFTVSYLQLKAGVEASAATLAMTWFTIGMLAGRLMLDAINKRVGDLATLYIYLAVAVVGVAIFSFFTGSISLVYLATALIGYGVGATFPVVLTFIGGAFRDLSGTAFSIALFIGLVGQSVLNKIAGAIFDAGHYHLLPYEFMIALAMIMLLVPIAQAAGKKMKR